jgi:hypothetical protein
LQPTQLGLQMGSKAICHCSDTHERTIAHVSTFILGFYDFALLFHDANAALDQPDEFVLGQNVQGRHSEKEREGHRLVH